MKQHITLEQLNELREEPGDPPIHEREKYFKWMRDRGYASRWNEIDVSNLMTIGQMIEFLEDVPEFSVKQIYQDGYEVYHSKGFRDHQYNGTLCDALWEAVKEILIEAK